jgi:hypothetical protein
MCGSGAHGGLRIGAEMDGALGDRPNGPRNSSRPSTRRTTSDPRGPVVGAGVATAVVALCVLTGSALIIFGGA